MELENHINDTFVQERNKQRTEVILKEVRGRKVVLAHPGRVDSFTMDATAFLKKFQLATPATA